MAVGTKDLERLLAKSADGVGIGAEDAELYLLRVAGAEDEALTGDHDVREVFGDELVDLGGDLGNAIVVVEVDEEKSVGLVVVLRGVGENEAKAASSGQLGRAGDALQRADVVGEGGEPLVRCVDGRALGHPEVDHHLLARGVGEEVLPDMPKAPEGSDEHHDQRGQDEVAVAEAAGEEAAVCLVEAACVRVVVPALLVGLQVIDGEERGDG